MNLKRTVWYVFISALVLALVFSFGCSCMKKAKKVETKPVTQPIPTPTPPPPPPTPKPPTEPVPPPPPPPPVPAPVEEKPVPVPPPPAEQPQAMGLVPIYFAFDQANLTPESIAALNKNVAMLKATPELKVVVEGNCDERGTVDYNTALGERRAKAAQEYYISAGIDKSRIRIISYGKERPIDPGHNEEAWSKNRRDDTVKETK
jgi:peptidoglycan-associated lipoprotein